MYFVIAKLDESRLVKMDFMVNFGVSLECIHIMLDAIHDGGDFDELTHTTFT